MALDPEKRELGQWWMWVLLLLVITFIVFGALNYLGIIGQTHVEREVFRNSFQYSEGQKQRIATFEAQLAKLKADLLNPKLDEGDKANINAQIAAIQIQLDAAKRQGRR